MNGGAAGGGKTYALLLEALRHINNPKFGAVIFRKEYTQITNQGGLWDSSVDLYSKVVGARDCKSPKLHWKFRSGAKVNFDYITKKNLNAWQGSQVTLVGYDELTHFSEAEFFYMFSRNRSTSGIRPYIRATCNPDPDSWVKKFIDWWIDPDSGYPIPERSGVIRWMLRVRNIITWYATYEEAVFGAMEAGFEEEDAKIMPKSVTFIASTLEDNQILMQNDPGYKANLMAMAEIEMEQLLKGNWKIKPSAGKYFKRVQIGVNGMLDTIPNDVLWWCRAWDLAATSEDENGNADYTSGVLIGKRKNGRFLIADVINQQLDAGDVETLIYNTARSDKAKYGIRYTVRLPQDPGQAGKSQAKHYRKLLAGFRIVIQTVSGSKTLRATPLAAQWQHGNVDVLIAPWNEEYFNQMESFPESLHDDMVDASSDAFDEVTNSKFNLNSLIK